MQRIDAIVTAKHKKETMIFNGLEDITKILFLKKHKSITIKDTTIFINGYL